MHDAGPQLPKISHAPLSVILLQQSAFADMRSVVEAWSAWLGEHHPEYELLLVLDESEAPNATGALAAAGRDVESIAALPKVRVVHHLGPAGMGQALQSALWLVRHPLIVCATCDRRLQPADLKRFLDMIDLVHLVAGYRVHGRPPLWLRGLHALKRLAAMVFIGYKPEPLDGWLGWTGWGRRWVTRHIFGVKVRDPECPLRMLRKEILRRIPLQSAGSFVHVELLAKANQLGCWMAEAPVAWTPPEPRESPDPAWGAEARALFRHPDFGPAVLPDEPPAHSIVASSEPQPEN
jgi:hypothetical protein